MEVRGVLFDFGNTLFTHASLMETIGECARSLGADIPDNDATALAARIDAAAATPQELLHPRDLDSAVWAQRWKVLYGIADERIAGLGDAVYASMHDPLTWIPYPTAATTLRSLHDQGLAVGIVSNTGWDVRSAFSAHSMSAWVTSFTLSYEIGFVKPDPKIFAAACEGLGLRFDDVLMVGDDPRADAGAVAVGIRTLLLPPQKRGSDNGLGSVLSLVTDSSSSGPDRTA